MKNKPDPNVIYITETGTTGEGKMKQKPDPNVISIADAGTTRYKQEGERVK